MKLTLIIQAYDKAGGRSGKKLVKAVVERAEKIIKNYCLMFICQTMLEKEDSYRDLYLG